MPVYRPRNTGNESLVIRKSRIPGAGKGLFTRAALSKDQIIIEYKGEVTTYKKIQDYAVRSHYVYYVNRNYVIDAHDCPQSLGRYANDAEGEFRFPGLANNALFVVLNQKVYLIAQCGIAAGAEILVGYGKAYWDIIAANKVIENVVKKNKRQKAKK